MVVSDGRDGGDKETNGGAANRGDDGEKDGDRGTGGEGELVRERRGT